MYPIGTNAINDRTIGESAQGLADYVKQVHAAGRAGKKPARLACAIAYDTRHQSRHFAELCAEVMVAAGFTVYFLDGYRSTPELSFLVRYKQCSCGIMVIGQPQSAERQRGEGLLVDRRPTAAAARRRRDRARDGHHDDPSHAFRRGGWQKGKIVLCQEEVDEAFFGAVLAQSQPGPRELKILYSPLHGVGAAAVLPVLERRRFQGCGALWAACGTERRFSERAGPRLESRKPRGVRGDHRAWPTGRARTWRWPPIRIAIALAWPRRLRWTPRVPGAR